MTAPTVPGLPAGFNILELAPRDATFALSTRPNETFTLGRWSLRVRAWAIDRFTLQGVEEIFKFQKIESIAEMAFFVLKEKDKFKSQEDFFDAIVTITDQIEIIKAMLTTVGIGEPEIKQIQDAINKSTPSEPGAPPEKKSSRPKKTGAKSST